MKDVIKRKRTKSYRSIRILLWIFIVITALLITLVLVLNTPAVQTFIVSKVTGSIREKTGAEVSVGEVKISFPKTLKLNKVYFQDQNADTLLYLGSLNVDIDMFSLFRKKVIVNDLNLENLVAHIHRRNADGPFNFQFIIDEFSPDNSESPDTTDGTGSSWSLDIKSIHLKDILFAYDDSRSGNNARIALQDFELSVKDFDFAQHRLDIDEILLKNASVQLTVKQSDDVKKIARSAEYFPGWTILADNLSIENTSFRLDNTSFPKLEGMVDYRHLFVSNLDAGIQNVSIDTLGYRAEIGNLSFSESCGFNLEKLVVNAQFTNSHMAVENLFLKTSASEISADASLTYSQFSDFLADFGNCSAMLDLHHSVVDAGEVFMFAPALAADSIAGRFKNSMVSVSAAAIGRINDLEFKELELSALQGTALKFSGSLTGLPVMKNLGFDVAMDHFSTRLRDVFQFVDPAVTAGLNLPESFDITGIVKGKSGSVHANLTIRSPYGSIATVAFYQSPALAEQDTVHVDFEVRNLQAGIIIEDSLLGEINCSGKFGGSGIANGRLSGKASVDIENAQYNHYTYKNIRIDGRIDGEIVSASASSTDPNLDFDLSANIDFSGDKQLYAARLDLSMLNLRALNFSGQDIAISTSLSADLGYAGLNDSKLNLSLNKTRIITSQKSIPVELINIEALSAADSLNVHVNSDFADATISGNINPESLKKILQTGYKKYFGIADTSRLQPGKHLGFAINVHLPGEFADQLFPGLDTLAVSKLEGNYRSDENELSFSLQVPAAIYSNVRLDSLSLGIEGKNNRLSMDLTCRNISSDSLRIENLRIKEQVEDGAILSEISITDSLGNLEYLFSNAIEPGKDYTRIRFLPGGLVLDGQKWQVDSDNYLEKGTNGIVSQNFAFSRDNQSVGFITDEAGQKLIFKNFALQNLLNIIDFPGRNNFIRGNLAGELVVSSAGAKKFVKANLAINDLYILDSLAGNLAFNVSSDNDRMDVEATLENEENKIRIKGEVGDLSGTPELNLDVFIDIINLSRFEHYSSGVLSDLGGKINGELSLKGTTENPKINGFLDINETAFKITSLGIIARISSQKINFIDRGIHLKDFVIEDVESGKLALNGDILTTNYREFAFDLHLTTKGFQPINSTADDNPLFFGKLSLDADISLKGDVKSPVIEADLKVDSATTLTYVIPVREIKLVSSDGVVYFLSPSESYDSLIKQRQGDYITDSVMSILSGMNLTLNLEIDPGASFRVDIDQQSGDYLTVGGKGDLSYSVEKGGKQSVNGIFEVTTGYYQLSFYDLVKKSFTIEPGSTISWSGNPMDAEINITAINVVTTPSVALMASESATMSDSEKNMFQKRLPYEVRLNIRGLLSQPEITFNIALPEKDLITNPLIATKLAQLNTEEKADELNKQVLALLITGTFIADNSAASAGGTSTSSASIAARNSVNSILADQMNNVSGKYIRHVDLNFGLTTFDDDLDGTSDTRTELDMRISKKLYHDRITVEAQGSFNLEGNKNSESSTYAHNSDEVAVTYDLKQDGDYKLKTYYQSGYDLFDGYITYGGFAFMFEREYDSLKRQKKTGDNRKRNEKRGK